MNIHRNMAGLAIILCIGVLLLTGVALAQDALDVLPETGAASTANSYVSQLDDLRAMEQPQVERTTAAANYSSYEFSSDLAALHEMALATATAGKSANTVPRANDYITTLDQLRLGNAGWPAHVPATLQIVHIWYEPRCAQVPAKLPRDDGAILTILLSLMPVNGYGNTSRGSLCS